MSKRKRAVSASTAASPGVSRSMSSVATPAVWGASATTCEEVDADASVRVLVLRGAGGRAFVSGTDISQFSAFTTAEDGLAYERELERRVARLERVAKPVIAQIEGYALGGGFSLAAAC